MRKLEEELHLVLLLEPGVSVDDVVLEIITAALEECAIGLDGEQFVTTGAIAKWSRQREDGSWLCRVTVNLKAASDAPDDRRLFAGEVLKQLSSDSERVHQVVRLLDPYLYERNEILAREIFELEMLLREALTLIFLDSYQNNNCFELLSDVEANSKELPGPEQMRAYAENEFFYVLFSDYGNVNNRRKPRDIKALIQVLSSFESFDTFRTELLRAGAVTEQVYEDFLAGIKRDLDPVERVRNAVAHNRAVTKRALGDYELARMELSRRLIDFLAIFS